MSTARIALRWCTEREIPIRVGVHAENDHRRAMQLFNWVNRNELNPDGNFGLLDGAWDAAVSLLDKNWTTVKRLAAALEAGARRNGTSFKIRSYDLEAICRGGDGDGGGNAWRR
jgi:hypothetical protein